jgi:hypothetical protein
VISLKASKAHYGVGDDFPPWSFRGLFEKRTIKICMFDIARLLGHLSLNSPNALIQETVRAYNATWYNDIVTALPRIEGGFGIPAGGHRGWDQAQ